MPADLHLTVDRTLRLGGQRYTPNRRVVVELLEDADRPLTIAELLEAGDRLAQSSVYRNLAVLEEVGVVHRVAGGDEFARYELAEDLTEHHHHHLICSSCGAVADFTVSPQLEHTPPAGLLPRRRRHRLPARAPPPRPGRRLRLLRLTRSRSADGGLRGRWPYDGSPACLPPRRPWRRDVAPPPPAVPPLRQARRGEARVTPAEEAARRRTFAIISHPDAGKTTLTEKFLLYGGALGGTGAGAVKAREGRRSATSDWMELEQKRGISITSTVLQFPYRGHTVNLLDTPGHRDFSEDTYRVLAAADAAVMVLDAAKGIEPQTLKLFEVCRTRGLPLLTFINKWDRPGRDALELIDEIERLIGMQPTPVTWPVGIAGDFRGVVDRRSGDFVRFTRVARGATEAPEEVVDPERAAVEEGAAWGQADEELALLGAVGADFDEEAFLAGSSRPRSSARRSPTSACALLLDAVIDLAPAPTPRLDVEGKARPLDAPLSGFVFKVQANMDPSHRDRIAYLRVCSGRFERGMVVTHGRTGKPFATKYAHTVFGHERETVEEAFPGDVVGLVNATDVRVGDSLYLDEPVEFPGDPQLRPRALLGGPGARHRALQAVPPGHRAARRGGRGAGAARPRPGRPGARARRGRADAVRGGRRTASRTSSARRSS